MIKDVTKTKNFGPPKKPKEDRSPERLLSDAVAKRKAVLALEELADLGLKEATRRKADWTPVKDSAAPASSEALKSTDVALTETPVKTPSKAQFGSLLQKYGLNEQSGNITVDIEATRVRPNIITA